MPYTVNSVVENNKVIFTLGVVGNDHHDQGISWRYAAMPLGIGARAHEHFLGYMEAFEKVNMYYEKY